MMQRWRADLEGRQLDERVELGREHTREIRAIETIGEAYQRHIKGLEERAERAAQTLGRGAGLQYDPVIDLGRLRVLADKARLDQTREVEGEEAYRERIRRIEALTDLSERVPPTRPMPQRSPRSPERGGGIER